MGGHFRRIAVLVAALACAALLAACGGGDDSSTQSASTAVEADSDSTSSSAEAPSNGASSTSSDESGGGGSTTGGNGSDSGAAQHQDLPVRGSVSPQSSAFKQYSGKGQAKLHLAEFGDEASNSSRGDASEVVVAYLQASGAEEWEKACGYLSATIKAQISGLSKESKSGGCAETLPTMIETFSPKGDHAPIYAPEGIASLRIKEGGLAGEGAGFALFHGSDGEDHWLALKREGGKWLVLSTSPQPFQ